MEYCCDKCDKKFKTHSGIWKHKKTHKNIESKENEKIILHESDVIKINEALVNICLELKKINSKL